MIKLFSLIFFVCGTGTNMDKGLTDKQWACKGPEFKQLKLSWIEIIPIT